MDRIWRVAVEEVREVFEEGWPPQDVSGGFR